VSDIVYPHSFSALPTDAEEFSKNVYNPSTVPDSLDVINGFLDNDNREAGWDIDHTHVRSQSMASGRMVGATANADYIAALFPVEATSTEKYKEMTPLAGCSISFFCPTDAAVGVFTWQVTVSNDSRTDPGAELNPVVMLFVDDVHKKETFRTLPGTMDFAGASVKNIYRDRVYSGHYTMAPLDTSTLTAGWHKASLRVLMPGDTSILSSSYAGGRSPLVRFRVRNLKVFWLA
tara:strand:- start:15961 stop:16659 length:699 start_codon:yes stop_codon:yes gene_type:complete